MANVVEVVIRAKDMASGQLRQLNQGVARTGQVAGKAATNVGNMGAEVSGLGRALSIVSPRLGGFLATFGTLTLGAGAAGRAVKDVAPAADDAGNALLGASVATRTAGVSMDNVKKNVLGLRLGLVGMVAAAAAVALVFAKSVGAAASFEKEMTLVATLVDTTQVDMKELANGVKDLAVELGDTPDDLAKGLFNVVSAGVSAANSLKVLEIGAKTAAAAGTDTKTAVTGLLSVVNAFGLEALGAADELEAFNKVANLFFVTNKFGVLTVGELSEVIGRVSPVAKEAGVSIEELLAAIAALTKGGLKTAEAVTALRATFNAFLKPQGKALEVMEQLGIKFDLAAIKAKGFEGILEDLRKVAKKDKQAVIDLIGSQEALTAVLALTGSQAASFGKILEAEKNITNEFGEAFDKVAATFDRAKDRFSAAFTVLAIELGEVLLPVLGEVLNAFTFFVKGIIEGVRLLKLAFTDLPKFLTELISGPDTGIKEGQTGLDFFTKKVEVTKAAIADLKLQINDPALTFDGDAFALGLVRSADETDALIVELFRLQAVLARDQVALDLLTAAEKRKNATGKKDGEVTEEVTKLTKEQVAAFKSLKKAIEGLGPAADPLEQLNQKIARIREKLQDQGKKLTPVQRTQLEQLLEFQEEIATKAVELQFAIRSAQADGHLARAAELKEELKLLTASSQLAVDLAKKEKTAALRRAGLLPEQLATQAEIKQLQLEQLGLEKRTVLAGEAVAEAFEERRLGLQLELETQTAIAQKQKDQNFDLKQAIALAKGKFDVGIAQLQITREQNGQVINQTRMFAQIMDQTFQDARDTVSDFFQDFFRGEMTSMMDFWSAIWNNMVSLMTNAFTRMLFPADNFFQRMEQGFEGGRGGFLDFFKNILPGGDGEGDGLLGLGILGLQKGGIVRKPTLALIGEAGPEAVVPLSRPPSPDVANALGIRRAAHGLVAGDLLGAVPSLLSGAEEGRGSAAQDLFNAISSGQDPGLAVAFQNIVSLGEKANETERAFLDTAQTEGAFAAILKLGETLGVTDKQLLASLNELDEGAGNILKDITAAAGSLLKSFGSFLGGIGGDLLGSLPIPFLQEGGIVKQRTLAVIGEGGPEKVIPLKDEDKEKSEGDVTIINVIDRSQLQGIIAGEIGKNRGVIVNDVIQDLQGNRTIRRASRRFG